MIAVQTLEETDVVIETTHAERRRFRRYPCQGAAEAVVLFSESLFRGEIRDISMSGCFIKTKAHLHVDRFSQIDLRFEMNDCQYHTKARVMDIRPGCGVGMEFYYQGPQDEVSFKRLVRSVAAQIN